MKKILLVDHNGIMIKNMMGRKDLTTEDGLASGGVLGFVETVIFKALEFNVDFIVSCQDQKRESLKRKEFYPNYKSNRDGKGPEIPDYKHQKDKIMEFLDTFKIEVVGAKGYEADDVIATLATKYSKLGFEVFILSGDKDFVQLIGGNVKMILPKSKKEIEAEEFGMKPGMFATRWKVLDDLDEGKNVLGVHPKDAIAAQSLMGDTADYIYHLSH